MAEAVIDPLKEKRVELVLGQLEELPTLPALAIRVIEATGRDGASAQEVCKLIASDPAMTARILRLVNRADVGVRNEVSSVERAVVLLGFEAVRSAVLAVSIYQTFSAERTEASRKGQVADNDGPAFTREAFWKHSIAVATCAELLARQLSAAWGKEGRIDPSEAFVCGLLHDLGKLALDAAIPKSFAKVVEAVELLRGNIADVERQIIGIDHMVVGKRLAEKWKLPAMIRDVIWLHGQAPSALPSIVGRGGGTVAPTSPHASQGSTAAGLGVRLINLVTLADTLARELHLGYSGNHSFPVSRRVLLEAIGLTEAQVSRTMELLVGAIEQRAEALGLGQASSEELYQQALTQANRELSRANSQLAVKNKRLAVRAKFFDALSAFHGQIAADAAPSLVLRAVAETAAEALGVKAVAAFSVPPGRNYAEIVLCQDEEDAQSLLIDCPERPEWSGSAGAINEAPTTLEFVTRLVSPRLGSGRRYWTALLADGACVGGVLWAMGRETFEEDSDRLSGIRVELSGLVSGWSLALRTSQIRDEARQLAEQLAEANRNLQDAQGELTRVRTLTTIAEVAAGAAHEMNNPLAVISGRSQLLASALTDDKLKRSAQLVAEQADRLSGMITELMDFAKPRSPETRESDVSTMVRQSVEAARNAGELTDRQVDVALGDVPMVQVDPVQVGAALTEVLANASQATEANTGVIRVTAAHDPFGGNVVLTVTDNGGGMDEHTARRAFDPFFSSRPAGRRRGMGLAKAQRWIEGCGGSIRLETRVGGGTRVIIVLPAVSGAGNESPRRRSSEMTSGTPAPSRANAPSAQPVTKFEPGAADRRVAG